MEKLDALSQSPIRLTTNAEIFRKLVPQLLQSFIRGDDFIRGTWTTGVFGVELG
jgi:hypothetical protein